MATANLVLRFAVELIGVGALAYWGCQASPDDPGRIALAIGAPLALVVVWALVVAPKARNALNQTQRDAIGTGLLVLAAPALVAANQGTAALVFGTVVVLNWGLMLLSGEEAAAAIRAAGAR